MAITSKETGDGKVTIEVSGRFDFAAHQDFSRTYKKYGKGEKCFVVDLASADYLDSSAMGMLLQLREYSNNAGGGGVTLANGNEGVKEILRIANFDKLFNVV